MVGATPKFALPYPVGTDPISDGDDQIAALATKLDTMFGNVRAATISKGTGTPGFKSTTFFPVTLNQVTVTMSAPGLAFIKARTDASALAGTGYVAHRIGTDPQSEVTWFESGSVARFEFHSAAWVYLPAGATAFVPQMLDFTNSAAGFTVNATVWQVSAFGGTPTLT